MSIETKVLGIIIAFLLFALIIGYHVARMMNHHRYPMGGMYPQPMAGYAEPEPKRGIPTAIYLAILVIIAIALIVIPDQIAGPSGDSSDGYLRQVSNLAMASVPSQYESTPIKTGLTRVAPNPDYSEELSGVNDARRPSLITPFPNDPETVITPTVSLTPVHTYGYQVKCGSNVKFVDSAVEDYQEKFPEARRIAFGPVCKHKVILFSAPTKQEVERWTSRTRRLPKGDIVSLLH